MGAAGKLLMICCNSWRSPFQVGSHHLARAFVRMGWEVGFVSDPISPWHLFGGSGREFHDRWGLYRQEGAYDLEGRLWAYVPGALFTPHNRPLLKSEWVHRRWPSLSLPDLVRVVRRKGFGRVDLLYCDSPYQAGWVGSVGARRSVFRVADNNEGFDKFTAAARRMEQEIVRSVDLVVYTAGSLEGRVRAMGPRRMAHLPNGVNFRHFAFEKGERPPEYAEVKGSIAVYVGAISAWFDWGLIREAARSLPEVTFILIGPIHHAAVGGVPSNVRLLGSRPYGELPSYLHHADLGIIPFDVCRHGRLLAGVNPLKLYEYMACGLPVVAMEWEELRNLHSPARLCGTPEEFVRGIAEGLAAPIDKEALVSFASRFDWGDIAGRLLREVDR
jgi:glycosyltransferase involved in cell wall biosynthesis